MDIVHPFGATAPEFMQSDRCGGGVLNFRQVGHVKIAGTSFEDDAD
jgi:hypothetical protein